MPSDAEIARSARLLPIETVASRLGISGEALLPYGKYKAKLDLGVPAESPRGKLILVTAINPTPPGEGKTTTSIGLGDALNAIGRRTVTALREPSLGPCFGMKGGATGGGRSQLIPMEEINLHFTGDFHAISAAHNLLSALIDNHLHWGNRLDLDPRRVSWRRVMDMNDRALRQITVGLGGPGNGFVRETGFDITVASEVMAIFCLAETLEELEERLGRITIGVNRDHKQIFARDLEGVGAMAVLLREAFLPNLVQTMENNPALVHGGPFANIAHGCNSVVATKTALGLGEFVVTEAGFGADLGAEKFIHIKCRKADLCPAAVVVVATIRALKYHGGCSLKSLGSENIDALRAGEKHLRRHLTNIMKFGLRPVVAINRFDGDTTAEVEEVRRFCERLDVPAIPCEHWARGGDGARELAETVAAVADGGETGFHFLYPDEMPLREKIETVAREIYGASGISASREVLRQIERLQGDGFGHYPVCMAKTPYSFSADPTLIGAPEDHVVPVREVRLSNGAGFVVVLCGDMMTMPGLPRRPAAERIRLGDGGAVEGLF